MSRYMKTNNVYYKNIALKIREKTEKEKTYTPAEMPSGIDEVFESGKNAEYIDFWNKFTNNFTRERYYYGMGSEGWNEKTFNPPATIYPINATSMFYAAKITQVLKTQVDFSRATTVNQAFYACTELKFVEFFDATSAVSLNGAFQGCYSLESLTLKVREENTYNDKTFSGCELLKNLIVIGTIAQNGFDVSSCVKLSRESLGSIVQSLSQTTQGLTVVLPKNAASLYGEGWSAVVGSRPNWTIAYGV